METDLVVIFNTCRDGYYGPKKRKKGTNYRSPQWFYTKDKSKARKLTRSQAMNVITTMFIEGEIPAFFGAMKWAQLSPAE